MTEKHLKYLVLFLIIAHVFILQACSDDRAGELFETAQFEELQNNREHAEQLYQEIIDKYPQSEFSGKARERLQELRAP